MGRKRTEVAFFKVFPKYSGTQEGIVVEVPVDVDINTPLFGEYLIERISGECNVEGEHFRGIDYRTKPTEKYIRDQISSIKSMINIVSSFKFYLKRQLRK